ncbi:MAG: mRNA-decapping enzyme subunit 2 [Thelocarpon impressellum]|nr:MAG: mRNA-decapping enzyme subunit 2 [Thelocarpon impressellum]
MTDAKFRLEDWLDDLCVRFIINLPQEELESVERICFQVEEAQWFYEDFVRPLDPALPSLNLRAFCLRIFQHCPLLSDFSQYHHATAFSEFLAYKTRVPVRGAIMLNDAMDEVVLVKGWKKGANWSFPRGKINKDEPDLDCAVREVYEETGFDIVRAGLAADGERTKFIEVTLREQNMRLYVFRGVPMDTHFEPRTRKEISKIQWHRLADLPTFRKKGAQAQAQAQVQAQPQAPPEDERELASNANKFYMVAPFLTPLKRWIAQQRRADRSRTATAPSTAPAYEAQAPLTEEEPATEYEDGPFMRPSGHFADGQARGDDHRGPPVSVAEDMDASARLKRLLSVPDATTAPVPEPAMPAMPAMSAMPAMPAMSAMPAPPPAPQAADDRSNALLALLRTGKKPQTPAVPTEATPPFPTPPHHPHPRPAPLSTLPPPPSFPVHPAHPAPAQQNQSRPLPQQPPQAHLEVQQSNEKFPSSHLLQQLSRPPPAMQPRPTPAAIHGPILSNLQAPGLTRPAAAPPTASHDAPSLASISLPLVPVMPRKLSFDRRGSQSAEHKQALLSLFGKGPPSIAALTSAPRPAAAMPTLAQLDTNTPGHERSTVSSSEARTTVRSDSLPTAGRAQTPITPVDKGFLLGYLEGVARGYQR